MPLAAVACALAALLHLGLPVQGRPTAPLSQAVDDQQVMFDPLLANGRTKAPDVRWVAPHVETVLWSGPDDSAPELAPAYQWSALQIEGDAVAHRLPVLDPSRQLRGWVQADDVGPIDPALLGSAFLPPVGHPIAWAGPARVTMYTCVELGGCSATASGIWPEPGMVAVDPRVIPLGSTVWIQGVGTFLAADTGSLVRGAHLDIYSLNYQEAINWGVQQRSILVFARD
jgi:3D (Asp-Asp-Asp) domain-containing protein